MPRRSEAGPHRDESSILVRVHFRIFVATTCVLLALSSQCRRVEAVDRSAEEKEAESLLVRYLRIDTQNPPGNETNGARFLQEIFRKEGIETRLLGSDPKRQSLYAVLRSGTNAPALVLMHHIDTVPATATEWSVAPFSGERAGGYIWGRGALDIKSLGIAWMSAILELKRSKAKLSRDIVYLAVADEEAGGARGAEEVLTRHPELFRNVYVVLNEGGSNETIVDRVSVFGIEIAQKVPLWLRLRTTGPAGHGSSPPDDAGSVTRLLEILAAVRAIPFENQVVPEAHRYLQLLSAVKPGRKGELLRNLPSSVEEPDFAEVVSPGYRSLLRNTLAITTIHAGDSVNSIPATASATIDIRLVPGSATVPLLEKIRRIAGDDAHVEVLLDGQPSPPAPVEHPAYAAISSVMKASSPSALVVPLVSSGTSDSRFFRQRGIVAYGVSPFKVNYYDADTVHGVDERIRIVFFAEGVRLAREIVRRLAAA
jgi:acetylornithine deacetylase/succinyl-diaminopimelate desuccinylase-like protein